MARILIVEDDEATQKIYHEKLTNEGFEVLLASTGSEGLTLALKEPPPDLILLDIMLRGDMNGFDVLEQIKKNQTIKKVPVLMLTNLGTEESVAKDIGAADYIIKANTTLGEIVTKIKANLK